MFNSARLKLTLWYCFILMVVCIMFSVVIFASATDEINRFEHMQRLRIEGRLRNFPLQVEITNPQLIEESRVRIFWTLVFIDSGILVFSAIFGYFLAGKTLKPIKDMVDDQNRFVTDASHELRTPLTALKSEIEVNLRDPKLSISEAKKLLKSNLEEVNNLQVLSDGLIKLTQYRKGHNAMTFETLNLSEVIIDSIKKIGPIAKGKDITITNNVQNVSFRANRQGLTELFVILLENAVKYSPKESEIIVRSSKNSKSVSIQVEDHGVGISQSDIDHLFDRFYRSEKSRTDSNTNGYGLGLSIAKQIVDLHRGEICVKSQIDQGSTFIVKLPLD